MAKKTAIGAEKGQNIPSGSLVDYPMKPDEEYQAQMRRQKAEDALHTIHRAEEHRKDRGLMRDVKKLAKEKIKHLSGICK